jgi:hypothetical protein
MPRHDSNGPAHCFGAICDACPKPASANFHGAGRPSVAHDDGPVLALTALDSPRRHEGPKAIGSYLVMPADKAGTCDVAGQGRYPSRLRVFVVKNAAATRGDPANGWRAGRGSGAGGR